MAGPQHLALAATTSTTRPTARRRSELDPVKRAAMFIRMNDLRASRPRRHPGGRTGRGSAAVSNKLRRDCQRLGHRPLRRCRTGTARRDRRSARRRPDEHYILGACSSRSRACSASASSCSRCWRSRRATRSRSWRPIRTCRPRCGRTCARKFGLDDPVWLRYLRWLAAMAAGRLGLLLRQPRRRRHADPAARCRRRSFVIGSSQILALADRAAGRHLRGDAALFAVRPDRQHARLRRLLAADLLHRPAASSCSSRSSSTGCPSSTAPTSRRPAGAGAGSTSGRRSCRSPCSACSRAPPGRATCARRCST